LAQFVALLPTIVKIVEQVHDIVSKAKVRKLGGYLGKDEMQKIQTQLIETKKNLASLKDGLYQTGKQILDYKDLYRASVESDAICKQLLNLLSDYTPTSKGKGKQPDNVGKVLTKLYTSLENSLGDLKTCIKPKNLTDEDFRELSKILNDLTRKQGSVENALQDRSYRAARDSLMDIDDKLKDVNKTASDSMYGVIKTVVDKLEG
jgi:hypothetical protein